MKTGQCEGCGRTIHIEAGDRDESPENECDCVECAGERDRRRVVTLEDAP
jgi:hypothetical protein